MPLDCCEASNTQVSEHCMTTQPSSSRTLRHSRRLQTASHHDSLIEQAGDKCDLPSPKSEDFQNQRVKRKREAEENRDTAHEAPRIKRRRSVVSNNQGIPDTPVVPHKDLVQAWVCNDSEWIQALRNTMASSDRYPRPLKRQSSSSSSIGRTSSSDVSKGWWDNRHAEQMQDGGLIMEERQGIAYTQQCQELCDLLLRYEEPPPDDWYLREPGCRKVLQEASYKNERRVERDVPPIICPSSELLSARGYKGLEHIREGLDAEWTACTELYGPKPEPSGSYGVSRHALTEEENGKLKFSTTADCEGSIFQFIVRQAKRSDGSLIKAERQAMHNASVACNTIVELYESIGAAEELDRQILAFSMPHNHNTVSIFAHYLVISAGSKTFHRQLLYKTDLLSLSSDLCRPYKITLGIFRHFYPLHLRRIKNALSRRPHHSIGSFTAQLSIDEDRHDDTSTPPSAQGGGQSKKASLASTVRLREENERLRTQVSRLLQLQQEMAEQQRADAREQKEEAREEARQQRVLLECQLKQMQEDSRQQQDEARQQRDDFRRQRDDFRRQLEQQNTIIELLRGKKQ